MECRIECEIDFACRDHVNVSLIGDDNDFTGRAKIGKGGEAFRSLGRNALIRIIVNLSRFLLQFFGAQYLLKGA